MPDDAPIGRIVHWQYDENVARADLDALDTLLSAKGDLSERGDILPFFRAHPHVAALLGSYNNRAATYDRLGLEVALFGRFIADTVIGDRARHAYTLVEFEDAQAGSVFVRRTRQVTEWSPRFLRGMAQLIDWLYLLDDQQQTLAFEEQFGPRPISVTVLLILGRDSRISDADRRRLRWWREHVVVDSHQLYCCTFDELVGDLRWRARWHPWPRTVPMPR